MTIAANPISNHIKGMPCMIDNMVGRIVGESSKSSWGIINGISVPSIPLFATPHGTVIESGRFYISEITEEGKVKLKSYEDDLRATGEALYNGMLTESEMMN